MPEKGDGDHRPLPEVLGPDFFKATIDERAKKEEEAIGRAKNVRDAQYYAERNSVVRQDKLDGAFHLGLRAIILLIAAGLCLAIVVWIIHLLFPGRGWLDESQFNRLQSLLLSGSLSALAATVGRRYLRL